MWRVIGTCVTIIATAYLIDRGMLLLGHINARYELKHPDRSIIKPAKVFQIGFSKCGTVTLADFFSSNGVPTIHHDTAGNLPLSMYQNHNAGLPLISEQYQKYYVYTDLDLLQHSPQISIGQQYFKELDAQYPGSKFILNIRDKNAWLNSRSRQKLPGSAETLLSITSKIKGISPEEVLAQWSAEWDAHCSTVLEYFKDRPLDLLVFNIERDPPQKIVDFFKDYFKLDARLYKHQNKSKEAP